MTKELIKETKQYQFIVPCSYYYEIEAESEEKAREILLDKGGIDIDGELLIDDDAYRKADCIGEII
jgi:hypothetical protein